MRVVSVFILSLLPLSAQQLPDAQILLEREANAFQSYVSYQYTEETTMQMTVMGNPVNVPMTIEVQAAKPNKLRMETKIGNVTNSLLISDGDTAWMYIPMLKQYSKLSGNEAALEAPRSQMIGDAAQIIASAVTRRSEAVDVDGMSHECWVVESRVAKQSMGGMEIQDPFYVIWVDKETGIALQRSVSGKMQGGPMPGSVETQMKSVKRALKFNEALSDSLFTFVPPADAKEADFINGAGAATAGFGLTPAPGRAVPPKNRQAPQPFPPPAKPPQPREPQADEPEAYVPFLNPIHREEASWPESAKEKSIQGMVQLLVIVNPQGHVSNAEALTGPEILRQPAIEAAKQWTFQPVLRDGRAVFAYTEATVDFMDHSKRITPQSIGLDVSQEMAAQQRIMEIQSRFPRSPAQVLADLEQDVTGRDGLERSLALPQLAKAAVAAGALDKALLYANELIASVGNGGWNNGNAVHDGNIVRGLVALRSGNIQLATKDLIEAGKTTGSPQLDSFGPNLILANELLEKGERDAVLEYLTLCRSFWKMGSSKLDAWINIIRAGGKPDFGANLLY
jgi:TonB family protein